MKQVRETYREIIMEGHPDDGKFGRGRFDQWVNEEPLNYCPKYIVRPSERISLLPKNRDPYVLEEYGEMIASESLCGCVTLSSGISIIPPGHMPMKLRKQNCEEALYIISGSGTVEVEDEKCDFIEDDAVFLPAWAKHRIANNGHENLVLMFVRGISMSPFAGFGEIETKEGYEILGEISGAPSDRLFTRKPVRYWKKIVVTGEDKIPHYSPDGKVALSPGQQGLNYLTPANVGAITVRLVGGKGPAALLGKVTDPFKEFSLSWHNTEEIHFYIEGGGVCLVDDQKIRFNKGDMIFTPARSIHKNYPQDESYREMCATGIRFRPFEGLTETGIDQREFMFREGKGF